LLVKRTRPAAAKQTRMLLELFSDEDFSPKKKSAPRAQPRRKASGAKNAGDSNRSPDADETRDEPQSAAPHVFSVSEITRSVRSLIETEIGQVWVQGEICNFRRQNSGHCYFGLKDERATLCCVLFNKAFSRCRALELGDGMLVQAHGEMTVYESRGQYQLNVDLVQPAGAGLLQARFEALKRKLAAEGFFDAERKKTLPVFPAVIGLVTSPSGAAIRDFLNIVHRRAPWMRVVISPVRVQGESAAAEIATAIAEFNAMKAAGALALDVVVICRGGGSAEDLWAFNEESVARAIFSSAIPVVSAVGHEIDFTISDFVADLRAPTPSAAAELIAPDGVELARRLAQMTIRIRREMANCVAKSRARVVAILRSTSFREPQRKFAECSQRLDFLNESLLRNASRATVDREHRLARLAASVQAQRPDSRLKLERQKIESLRQRIACRCENEIASRRNHLSRAASLLRALSPETTLARGYTISATENGEVITDPAQVSRGAAMITTTAKGKIRSVVN